MKLDVQGQGGGRILDVAGQGGVGSLEKSPIFKDVIYLSSLNEQRNITHKGKLMTDLRGNLNIFIDDDGILPVKDRLEN